jgi:hypothetical protein
MAWWSTKTAGTYEFKLVMHFSTDPRNIVHDTHGTFELEEGETISDAQTQLIKEYRQMKGIPCRADVQVLRWEYS